MSIFTVFLTPPLADICQVYLAVFFVILLAPVILGQAKRRPVDLKPQDPRVKNI